MSWLKRFLYGPNYDQLSKKQNNLLTNNPNNTINQEGNNMLYQNLLKNKNNPSVPLNSTNYINNNVNNSNRNASFDTNINNNRNCKTIYVNKDSNLKRNLSSSGILKPSKRNKKFDKVLKNGKKLKNIDINRDYDENPDDDISSNMSSASNIFKNKLNKKTNNINSIIFEENSISSSHKSNKSTNDINLDNKESTIKKATTQFSVSKQNFFGINPQYQKKPIENGVYNLSLSTIPEEINPQISNPDTNNAFLNFPQNLEENINQQAFTPQPQEFMNQDEIYPSSPGKGFKFCSQLSKAGKNLDGHEKIDQDTPLICISLGGIEGFNIFGVLDGHGNEGHFVSRFCKDYFINKMQMYVQNLLYNSQYITAEDIYLNLKSSGFAYIIESFLNADNVMKMQSDFDSYLSGTTCNLIFQFNNHILDFNVGDSRSVLIEDSGDFTNQIVHPLSIDHKPDLPEELKRIQECGGTVQKLRDFNGNELGPFRVFKFGSPYPGLAMSRSLGDLQAKECGVIPEPEIFEYEINSNTRFIVVCSDGVWEFLTNENVKNIGNEFYKKDNVAGFCKELIDTSASIWDQYESIRDDITAVAVFF